MTARALPTRTLPPHPDLRQLRRQAKALLDGFIRGDGAAVAEVTAHYHGADAATPWKAVFGDDPREQMLQQDERLTDFLAGEDPSARAAAESRLTRLDDLAIAALEAAAKSKTPERSSRAKKRRPQPRAS